MQTYYAKENDDLNEVFNMTNSGHFIVVLPENCTYHQKVFIKRDDLEILANNSKISYSDHNGMREGFGTGDSATLTICSNNVTIKDLVVENSFDYLSSISKHSDAAVAMGRQAVALFTRPESTNSSFYNCTFSSFQDTVFTDGIENYFENCTILGNIDFIFGRSFALFKNCKIISVGKGFICAPSTAIDKQKGLCFENCIITCTDDVEDNSVYLARPWHPSERNDTKSYVSFKNCTLDRHINNELWTKMLVRLKGIYHYPEESRFFIDKKSLETLSDLQRDKDK